MSVFGSVLGAVFGAVVPRGRARRVRGRGVRTGGRIVVAARAAAAALLAVVVTLGLAMFAPAAHAVQGQISFDRCFSTALNPDCVPVPSPLRGRGVAVSPDGKSVYAVSPGNERVGAIAHFRRSSPFVPIAFDSCHVGAGTEECVELGGRIAAADDVAVSADGKSVYVVGDFSVAHFGRNTNTGKLGLIGCYSNADRNVGCTRLEHSPIARGSGVAVSQDGKSVYVTAANSGTIAHFIRNTDTGRVGYGGCVNASGSQGCSPVASARLDGAADVAISPDNKSVYVASSSITGPSTVTHFIRSTTSGQLSYDRCLSTPGVPNCFPVGLSNNISRGPLDGAASVTVSPDGKNVYVASTLADSITVLGRNSFAGSPQFGGCMSDQAGLGCATTPARMLGKANSVAVSPDGASVYVTASGSGAVSPSAGTVVHFFRSTGGQLPVGQISLDGCLASNSSQGCWNIQRNALIGARGVAVSPDNGSVYVMSAAGFSHLTRALI